MDGINRSSAAHCQMANGIHRNGVGFVPRTRTCSFSCCLPSSDLVSSRPSDFSAKDSFKAWSFTISISNRSTCPNRAPNGWKMSGRIFFFSLGGNVSHVGHRHITLYLQIIEILTCLSGTLCRICTVHIQTQETWPRPCRLNGSHTST